MYAFIEVKAFEEAEKLVEQFIPDKFQCSEENDMMFVSLRNLMMRMKSSLMENCLFLNR